MRILDIQRSMEVCTIHIFLVSGFTIYELETLLFFPCIVCCEGISSPYISRVSNMLWLNCLLRLLHGNIEINAIFICVLISSGDKYDNGVITKARPRYPYWGKSSRPDKNRNPQPSSESTGMRAIDILIIFCKVALPYGMK